MFGFKRTPALPLDDDLVRTLAAIANEQVHICSTLDATWTAIASQQERWLSDLDRVHARLSRIEACLLRIDLWASERIDGWPTAKEI